MTRICVLDAETYYDREFSLSKMTTEHYCRDARFEIIGCAFKWGDGDTEWVEKPDVSEYVMQQDWSDTLIVCQNTAFDGFILHNYFGVQPLAWLDIMGMSRALFPHEKSHSLKAQAERAGIGAKGDEVLNALGKRYVDFTPEQLARYGEYCINDVELTHALFHRYLGMGFPKKELKLIDLTLRMFVEPVLELDPELLRAHLAEVRSRKQELLERVRDNVLRTATPEERQQVYADGNDGIKRMLMSNQQFAEALRSLGVEPPIKTSPTTGKETFAFAKTDEAFKELEEHPSEDVQALVAARLGNKTTIEETRTERFIDMATRGAFPVPLRYYGAHSGRWSGQDKINLQNLPSRGANAGQIKKAILAPKGYVVIDCDSAQIEARTLAWLAGQTELVETFRNKGDVYKLMASKIYGVSIDQVDKTQRQVGKTVVLGAGYGVGHQKLQLFLKNQAGVVVTIDEAKRIIDTYRQASDKIVDFWSKAGMALRYLLQGRSFDIDAVGICRAVPGKGITLPNGLFIQYPDLRSVVNESGKQEFVYTSKGLPVRIYGGKCLGADTEVLTDRGWVRITDVLLVDRVWDGVEWVEHSGLTSQGEKHTIILDGVSMTPDHKVHTQRGWVDASQGQGLHRSDFRMPDGSEICGVEWAPLRMGVPVCLRGPDEARSSRRSEVRAQGREPLLRVSMGETKHIAWDVEPSGLLGMAVNAGSLPAPVASGMGKLWGAWDSCVRGMGQVVRCILGRHGAYVPAWAYTGSGRQQRGLLPAELPMDYIRSSGVEPAGHSSGRSQEGGVLDGYTEVNPSVSVGPQPVYDIINAGPRSRFVVRGATGPLIVHNCVENLCQSVARQIVAEQMLRVAKRYRVVLTVHDAVAIVAREAEAAEAQAYLEECMSWNPAWAVGLPLACESGVGKSYGDC